MYSKVIETLDQSLLGQLKYSLMWIGRSSHNSRIFFSNLASHLVVPKYTSVVLFKATVISKTFIVLSTMGFQFITAISVFLDFFISPRTTTTILLITHYRYSTLKPLIPDSHASNEAFVFTAANWLPLLVSTLLNRTLVSRLFILFEILSSCLLSLNGLFISRNASREQKAGETCLKKFLLNWSFQWPSSMGHSLASKWVRSFVEVMVEVGMY